MRPSPTDFIKEERWRCHACGDVNVVLLIPSLIPPHEPLEQGSRAHCNRCSQASELDSPGYKQLVRLGCAVRYYLGNSFKAGRIIDLFTVSVIRCVGGEALTQVHEVNLKAWDHEELIEKTCRWALERPGLLRIDHEEAGL